MAQIFEPVVSKIVSLMVDLLYRALAVGTHLDKMVLTGGFGDSDYLRQALKMRLRIWNEEHTTDVELIVAPARKCGTGTATGALTRAMNKEHGPARALRMSVGVIRTIHWEPDEYVRLGMPEVNAQQKWRDPLDRQYYIKDVIHWRLKTASPCANFSPYEC